MSARVATVVFGLATLVILLAFSWLPDVSAAYPSGEFGPALSEFQRATAMAELNALFGDPADPAKLAAMTAGNRLDLYAFIPAYTLFLIAAAVMLSSGARTPPVWFAMAAALLGAGADVFETWMQLEMTADWSRAEELLPAVAPACWTKYFALAVHALACSAICLLGASKRWILGAGGFLPILGVSADFAGVASIPSLMSVVFGAFWLALLGVAAAEIVRKKA
jgi:hypothetical protein